MVDQFFVKQKLQHVLAFPFVAFSLMKKIESSVLNFAN